jgi:hypothetical protein
MNHVKELVNAWEDQRLLAMIEANDPKAWITTVLWDILGMMNQKELPMNNVWRVQVNPDGKYMVNDFTLPSQSSNIKKLMPKTEVPRWVLEAISVLQIAEDDTTVDGVGKRISSSIYYIFEPMNEG